MPDTAFQHGTDMNKKNLKKLLQWAGISDESIKSMLAAHERAGVSGRVRITSYKVGTKKIIQRKKWSKNLVVCGVNTGRNLICQRLAGTNTYSLNITHADIGTGTTSPQNSDSQLETPLLPLQPSAACLYHAWERLAQAPGS